MSIIADVLNGNSPAIVTIQKVDLSNVIDNKIGSQEIEFIKKKENAGGVLTPVETGKLATHEKTTTTSSNNPMDWLSYDTLEASATAIRNYFQSLMDGVGSLPEITAIPYIIGDKTSSTIRVDRALRRQVTQHTPDSVAIGVGEASINVEISIYQREDNIIEIGLINFLDNWINSNTYKRKEYFKFNCFSTSDIITNALVVNITSRTSLIDNIKTYSLDLLPLKPTAEVRSAIIVDVI